MQIDEIVDGYTGNIGWKSAGKVARRPCYFAEKLLARETDRHTDLAKTGAQSKEEREDP